MIPIQELLSRIRWDREFGQAHFVIGYYDRMDDRIIKVDFRELSFPADDRFDVELVDDEGIVHTIPLHRVKDIYRNGELIWHRDH